MSREAWRPHIEDAPVLSLTDLRKAGFFDPERPTTGTLTWSAQRPTHMVLAASCGVSLEERHGIVSLSHLIHDPQTRELRTAQYVVDLETSQPHIGGVRWWFRCPYTGKRAIKLYLFPGMEKFCHRTGVSPLPTYASQRLAARRQVTAQRWALREKLHDIGTLRDELFKPMWMRWHTFARYAERDKVLEQEEFNLMKRCK